MTVLEYLSDPAWRRLGLTLLHFLWQGAAIAAACALVIGAFRLRSSAARYGVSLFALMMMLACPVATFLMIESPASGIHTTVARVAAAPDGLPAPAADGAAASPAAVPAAPALSVDDAPATRASGRMTGSAPIPPPSDLVGPALSTLAAIWLAGVVILASRLLLGAAGLWRWRRGALPLPGHVHDRVGALASRLGLKHVPRVAGSRRVRQPVTFGLLRPIVLLPISLVSSLPPAALEAVIAHELAHLRRHDRWVILVQRLVEVLLFYHPAVWWLSRRVSIERELCCDAMAVEATDERIAYAEALASVARMDLAAADPGLAMGFGGRRRALLERVRHVLGDSARPSRGLWPSGALALTAVAVCVALTWSRPGPAQEQAEDAAASSAPAVELLVIDQETKDPLGNARLIIRRGRENTEATTDADGRYRLEVPKPVGFVEVRIEADEHVAARKRWRKTDDGRLELPETLTLAIPRGVTVGGRIVNEEGEPVEGAVVRVTGHGAPSFPGAYVKSHAATTGATGHWATDPILPPDTSTLMIGIAHPAYVSHVHSDSVSTSSSYMANSQPSIGELYEHTAVITMVRGITVSGRVLDAGGDPVPDTTVAQEPFGSGRPLPKTRTDADGAFRFQAGEGPTTVVVHPEGYAPAAQDIDVGPNLQPITLKVQPGAVVHGRVVGPDGAPLADAMVGVEAYPGSPGPKMLPWHILTEADGRFEWRSAPHEAASYTFLKDGYTEKRGVSLVPRGEEYVIELVPVRRISGTVTDAQTGAPIDRFTVTPGVPPSRPTGDVHWLRRDEREFGKGAFAITLDDPTLAPMLLVEADGYMAQEASFAGDDRREVHLEVALEPGAGPSGIAHDPEGRPVAGAEVVLSTRANLRIQSGTIPPFDRKDRVWTRTDENGRFTFAPQPEAHAIAVLHERGYAVVDGSDVAPEAPIVLQPWSRVVGRYLVGRQPAPRRPLTLNMLAYPLEEEPGFQFLADTRTDSDGRFVFKRVPAGVGRIKEHIPQTQGLTGLAQVAIVEVEPGGTSEIQMGGRGRPVVGRLALPEGADRSILWTHALNQLTPVELKNYPDGWADMSGQEKFDWIEKRKASGEARAHWERSFRDPRTRHFQLEDDGAFRIDDVLPGTYEMSIEIARPTPDRRLGGETVATLTIEFEVPAMPASGYSDEPLDVGRHVLELSELRNLPAQAPAFETQTLDGAPLRLADHAGRYVLLDFWATWCGPCVAQTPHLKKVYEAYGADERFAMIALSLDAEAEPARAYAEKHELPWIQGHLGAWSETDVPRAYGVNAIPAIMLIDPEGRIVARDLKDERILSAVEAALSGTN